VKKERMPLEKLESLECCFVDTLATTSTAGAIVEATRGDGFTSRTAVWQYTLPAQDALPGRYRRT